MVDVQETYRRLEPVHLVLALVWGLCMSLPIAVHWPTGPAMVASWFALDAAGLVLVHLTIRLAALNLNLPRGYQMNAGRHQRQGVTSMLDRVPEEPNDGPVERGVRYGYLVLAAAAVGSAVAASRYLLSIDPM
ncbi:hypothetical protein [Micromonospora chersina]|uniref:hypothetical protein n=1 Tax=Micromonospora chersina TaxID=47854 RepID=UPI003711F729